MFKRFMEGAVFAIAFVAALVALVIGVVTGLEHLADLIGAKAVGILCAVVLTGVIGGFSAIMPSGGTGPN